MGTGFGPRLPLTDPNLAKMSKNGIFGGKNGIFGGVPGGCPPNILYWEVLQDPPDPKSAKKTLTHSDSLRQVERLRVTMVNLKVLSLYIY